MRKVIKQLEDRVPPLHIWIIQTASLLAVMSFVMIPLVGPSDKEFYKDTSMLLIAFIMGKFTNGFSGKRQRDADESSDTSRK